MKHRWITHQNCDDPHCHICIGRVAHCEVCNLAEGELTDDCPGARVPTGARRSIYRGQLNFRDGVWRHEPSSLGWADRRLGGDWPTQKRRLMNATNHYMVRKEPG